VSTLTVDKLVNLAALCLQFGRVNRITYHEGADMQVVRNVPQRLLTPEYQAESDTDHTVMLTMLACTLVEHYYPEFNLGLVAQYATVHDFVEVFAGDTPTLAALPADQLRDKEAREEEALELLALQLGRNNWVVEKIHQYRGMYIPEARFVWGVDKLCPKFTHLLNNGRTLVEQGVSYQQLADRYELQRQEFIKREANFSYLMDLRQELASRVLDMYAKVLDGKA
jgi:putative hydrolase of HD superfamily